MDDDKLVRMANQFASFFRAYPDDEAARGIADHIEAFWTPRMSRTLAERVAAHPDGVDRLVVLALAAPEAESPIAKSVAGPEALGGLASDAG